LVIHDLLSLRYKNISTHQRFYFKYLLPLLIHRTKKIVTVSETTKKDIVRFLGYPAHKIDVIYNGYDDKRYFPTSQNEKVIEKKYGFKNYLLAIGPTYPHKNFELLLSAYKQLDQETQKQYPLIIAGGKKNYLSVLKKQVQKLGLEKQVHFLGYVPIELMPALYREALTFIFPSLYEGFGIPLLEAMACGCPLIVSNISSMHEVCDDAREAYFY
ncbi:MAG: glycosyltransferase family 4 protein, partial [Sphingobacteriales bacterium]|nr:glycosyltransferase family 4 protein [Sphingobacteriales bacterium]